MCLDVWYHRCNDWCVVSPFVDSPHAGQVVVILFVMCDYNYFITFRWSSGAEIRFGSSLLQHVLAVEDMSSRRHVAVCRFPVNVPAASF